MEGECEIVSKESDYCSLTTGEARCLGIHDSMLDCPSFLELMIGREYQVRKKLLMAGEELQIGAAAPPRGQVLIYNA